MLGPRALFLELGWILPQSHKLRVGEGGAHLPLIYPKENWDMRVRDGTWVREQRAATEPELRAQCRGRSLHLLAQPLLQWAWVGATEPPSQRAASLPESTEESARMGLEIGKEMNLIRPKQAICLQEVTFRFPWKSTD